MLLSIIVGALALFFFGFLWYGPVFGKQWIKLSGMTPEQVSAGANQSMIWRMLTALAMSVVTAWVVYFLNTQLFSLSPLEFIMGVLMVWAGFALPLHLNGLLWESKSGKLVLFNIAESALSFVLLATTSFYLS